MVNTYWKKNVEKGQLVRDMFTEKRSQTYKLTAANANGKKFWCRNVEHLFLPCADSFKMMSDGFLVETGKLPFKKTKKRKFINKKFKNHSRRQKGVCSDASSFLFFRCPVTIKNLDVCRLRNYCIRAKKLFLPLGKSFGTHIPSVELGRLTDKLNFSFSWGRFCSCISRLKTSLQKVWELYLVNFQREGSYLLFGVWTNIHKSYSGSAGVKKRSTIWITLSTSWERTDMDCWS